MLGNWERGDPPINRQHRNFFSSCKRAQRKPCPNVPIPPPDQANDGNNPLDIHTPIGGAHNTTIVKANAVIAASDRGTALALTNQPSHKQYSLQSARLNSYKYWTPPPTFSNATDITITPHSLSEAGFFYEGPADNVRCFWCDGGLQQWDPNDDPWDEHAHWYPGCRYLFLIKGATFITNIQLNLSDEERTAAANIEYNNAGTDFLHTSTSNDPTHLIQCQDWYVILNKLGFDNNELNELARAHNFHLEDFHITSIVDTLLNRRSNDYSDLTLRTQDPAINNLLNNIQQLTLSNNTPKQQLQHLQQLNQQAQTAIIQHLPAFLDLTNYTNEPPKDNLTEEQRTLLIVAANTCINCNLRPKNTVTLPCGHFIYCSKCVSLNTPNLCHVCHKPLTGTCQIFFA